MRKRTVRILSGIAVIIVVLGVVYAVAVAVSAAKLRQAYAALQADGRPMDPALVIPPTVPDTENAALFYESAILLLKATPSPERPLRYHDLVTGPLEADQRTELERLVRREAINQAVALVEQGTQRASFRFDCDYSAGFAMRLPHLLGLRDLTGILGARAYLEAQAGRPDAAWNLALTQLRFVDVLRGEPVIVSQLVRVGNIRFTCTTIQRLCEVSAPSDQQTAQLVAALSRYDDVAPMVRALDGERLLCGQWMFDLPRKELIATVSDIGVPGYVPEPFVWLRSWWLTFKPLFLADHAAYMRAMHEATQRMERGSLSDDAERLDAEFLKAQEHHPLTKALVPALARIGVLRREMIAEMRITRAGLALLQYRQAHGAFPEALDTLGLADVADPFTETPLLYNAQGDGFVLYSVGVDRKDDGGRPEARRQKADSDIVWRFPASSPP